MANLYMVQMMASTPSLLRIAERQPLRTKATDIGYLVHCQLNESFKQKSPQAFAIASENGPSLKVLAYSSYEAQELEEAMNDHRQTPGSTSAWQQILTKKMPGKFAPGSRYSFEVRLCPVVRKSRGTRKHKPGAEIDVYLNEIERNGGRAPADKHTIYKEWLAQLLARSGAQLVEGSARIRRLRLGNLVRRTKNRSARAMLRPDVNFAGQLLINEPQTFRGKLLRGFGRHTSFGFGMMLLRRTP